VTSRLRLHSTPALITLSALHLDSPPAALPTLSSLQLDRSRRNHFLETFSAEGSQPAGSVDLSLYLLPTEVTVATQSVCYIAVQRFREFAVYNVRRSVGRPANCVIGWSLNSDVSG